MEQRPNGEKGKIRWGRREIGENSIIIIITTTIKKKKRKVEKKKREIEI